MKYPTTNNGLFLHGVIKIEISEIKRDRKGGNAVWRTIKILNDDNEMFELTVFSRDSDANDLYTIVPIDNVKTEKAEDDQAE